MPISKIPDIEKQAFISLVNVAPYPGGPREAARLQELLIFYYNIPLAIQRQLSLYKDNIGYLTQCMAVFDDTNLQAAGIWNNKTISSPPLTNPILIVNSDFQGDDVFISAISPVVQQNLMIMGDSFVSNLIIDGGTTLSGLYIGPGSTVEYLDSSAPGASVQTIGIDHGRGLPAILTGAAYGSSIGTVTVADGSYYGGILSANPANSCSATVTDLTYGVISNNTIQLTWTPPSLQSPPVAYLFINAYFRIKGSNIWTLADDSNGTYNGDSGITFTELECNTSYEFIVVVTCNNGGTVSSTPILQVSTTAADCS